MLLSDEFVDLALDKPKRGKSEEQLAKHTLDPSIEAKPVERAFYLLTKGDEVQKINVVESLPLLLNTNSQAVQTRLIPKIQQDLPSSSSEFNVVASKTFKTLIEKKIPSDVIMIAVYQGIECKDPVISNAWFDTLIDVIKLLDESQIKEKVLPFTRDKCSLNQPLYHRVASCKIIGAIASYPKFSTTDVKREVLPAAQSLCQDPYPEIRATIAHQIPFVMKGLGSSSDKNLLLPCLVELASDEKPIVKSAAVAAIVGCFPYINADAIKETIVPLVRRLFEKYLEMTDSATVALAKEIGTILKVIEPFLTNSNMEWYLKVFKSLSARGKPGNIRETFISQEILCRDHCAANLPALADLILMKIPDKFDLYYSILKGLASDPCFLVRRTVAEHFHEISETLGIKNGYIKTELLNLLKDDVDEIIQALVMNLDITLQTLTDQRHLAKKNMEPLTSELGNTMLKCQQQLMFGNNWRLLTNFLNRMQYLPNCMPSDYIHQNFTPVILNIAIEGRAKPIRIEACRTLLWFLRNNTKESQRQWLRDSLISNLCYSRSFYTRQIFVKMCADALEIFPNKYFKDFFYIPLMSLIDDKVPNIRYGVLLLLPKLRLGLTSQDFVLQKLFTNAISKLKMSEKDRDVRRCFDKLRKDLEGSIPISMVEYNMNQEKKKSESNDPIYLRRISDNVYQTNKATDLNLNRQPSNYANKNTVAKVTPPKIESKTSTSSRPSSTSSKNEMSFLEQHFYVDAGVVFSNNSNSSSSSEIKEQTECKVQSPDDTTITTEQKSNVTDDDKYKIHLKTFKSDVNVSKKRHSNIIFSSECLENVIKDKHVEKRRSLNLNSNENSSKIPVSSKYFSKFNNLEQKNCKAPLNTKVPNKIEKELNRNQNSFIPLPKFRTVSNSKICQK